MVLAASNPTYTSLSIMQKPSWVHPPALYKPGSISSLSVAFEDPDSSKLKVLLAKHYLYAYGNRTLVQKWKYHQKNSKDNSKSTTSQHSNTSDSNDNKDINYLLTQLVPPFKTASAPPLQLGQPTCKSSCKTRLLLRLQ